MMTPEPAVSDRSHLPTQTCQVFAAHDFYVTVGVNQGEGLGPPDEVCAGDIYVLEAEAAPLRLVIGRDADGQCVGPGSQIGDAGDRVDLVVRYRMMSPLGEAVEILLLRAGSGGLCMLPLSPLDARSDYTLVAVEAAPEAVLLADLLCVSFARGTMITLGDGRQHPIEALRAGDMVLTRDRGRQPVRWVGQATLRAVGAFAPVVIGKGTLGNAGDLVVSQHHRIFLYQRQRLPGIETSELLVQAKHLVDGQSVWQREGGFVDYFSLVFDHHEIIYAEGIPVESLMVNEATVTRLPPAIAAEVQARFPGLSQVQHFGTEAGRQLLDAVGSLRPPRRGG
ncbi:MAG: Hint domain-containing protein [Gemmobacter sp.]